ncbi:MAG: SAM-dependent methyltransferase [Myxococcota bacterium]
MEPTRIVHCEDGVAWLRARPLPAGHAIITSLPDSSEVPRLGFEGWRAWFIDAAEAACRACADDAVAIFFQTDVKRDGRWVDKGHLVQLGAERAGSHLLWHKVVCRAPPGVTTFGRPSWAHLLAFSRSVRVDPGSSTPDVLPKLGEMTWARAMGVAACEASCRFLLDQTACRTVVDPFCGVGTALAVANAMGMSAVGVELSRKRAQKAQTLQVAG